MADPELRAHPDRRRWNARYADMPADFAPHPLVAEARVAGFPAGPVLELACGRSGSALAIAAAGRDVVAVDISDLALDQLAVEASRRGLADRLTIVHADVPSFRADPGRFALVLATFYWDAAAFGMACAAVRAGGLLGWQALVRTAGRTPRLWELAPGQLRAALLPVFELISDQLVDEDGRRSVRILARRR